MVVSTDGLLVYGYDLGGDDGGWKFEGLDECGSPFGQEEGEESVDTKLWHRILATVGFKPGDDYKQEMAAEKAVGVELVRYCSDGSEMYLLAAKTIRAYRGWNVPIDFAELDNQRVEGAWDEKLSRAIQAMGYPPEPGKAALAPGLLVGLA
jgi:hypothetical protein